MGARTLFDGQGQLWELSREPVGHLRGGGRVGGRSWVQRVFGVALVGLGSERVHGGVEHER